MGCIEAAAALAASEVAVGSEVPDLSAVACHMAAALAAALTAALAASVVSAFHAVRSSYQELVQALGPMEMWRH